MTSAEHVGFVASGAVLLAVLAALSCRGYHRGAVVRRRLNPDAAIQRRLGSVDASPAGRWCRAPMVPTLRTAFGAASRRHRSERLLIEWIDGATRSVRAGASLREALIAGVSGRPSVSAEFGRLRDDLARRPLGEALDRFVAANPSPSVSLAARCISLAGDTGGRPARVLEGVSFTIRERLECGREARALATQARSSAAVIMVSPIVFTVVAASVDRRTGAFLFGSVSGLACIVGGLLLEAVGCAWMTRLVRTST